jgi:uncharacterized membrane protein
MSKDYNRLNGYGTFPSEIVFNDNEFFIHQQFSSLVANIVLSSLFIVSGTLNIISAIYRKVYDWYFFLQVAITITLTIILVVLLFKFFQRNKRTYNYNEIKRIETNEISTYINLTFYFSDNSTNKIKLYRNRKGREFVKFLRSKILVTDSCVQE